jgi:hypothetical protein
MARFGRKTMRRGEAFFEKNIVSGLVAKKNSSRRTQARTNFARIGLAAPIHSRSPLVYA